MRTAIGRVLRGAMHGAASLFLWTVAVIGLLGATIWALTAFGLLQPLIVVSDSMRPAIERGDLLLAVRVDAQRLRTGDIVSVPANRTERFVTHRLVDIAPSGEGWELTLRGDANDVDDPAGYLVGSGVLQVVWRGPGIGRWVELALDPAVGIPLLVAVAALIGLAAIAGGGALRPRSAAGESPRPRTSPGRSAGSRADAAGSTAVPHPTG